MAVNNRRVRHSVPEPSGVPNTLVEFVGLGKDSVLSANPQ